MKQIDKKIFEKLREKAELSTNIGRRIDEKYPKPTLKTRRHSGRKEVYYEDEGYVTQFVYYDNWDNYRDGFRDDSMLEKDKIEKKRTKTKKFCRKMKEITHKTE